MKEKLGAKYVWFDVKTNSKKELVIQVVGDDEYFNSVKDNMATIAKSVMRTSTLKDYAIVFERWDFNNDENDETFKKEKELSISLGADFTESLKEYEEIRSITIKYQKSLTIETTIKSTNNEAHQLANRIEATVNEFLKLNLLSRSNSYEIKILNIKGITFELVPVITKKPFKSNQTCREKISLNPYFYLKLFAINIRHSS